MKSATWFFHLKYNNFIVVAVNKWVYFNDLSNSRTYYNIVDLTTWTYAYWSGKTLLCAVFAIMLPLNHFVLILYSNRFKSKIVVIF